MFEASHPWWHFVVRAVLVYTALMVMIRLSGKRTVGEFTPFDMVVVILLGEAVQGALNGGDTSVSGGMIAAATLVAMNFGIGMLTTRSAKFDRLVEGEPVVLVRDGVLLEKALRRNNIPSSDLDEALRKAGIMEREHVAWAVLETDGKITVIPK